MSGDMRILILTPWYYPSVHPRAYRWSNIAARWAACGHDVHVVCARHSGWGRCQQHEGVWVHRVGYDSLKEFFFQHVSGAWARGRIGAGLAAPSRRLRVLSAVYRHFWKRVCFPDDAWLWYMPAWRAAEKLHRERPFDAVVSVSLPFSTHLAGRAFKRRHPQVRWLADVGDPYSVCPGPLENPLYRPWGRRLERATLTEADAVALTNPAAADLYQQQMGLTAERLAVIPPLWAEETPATEAPLMPKAKGWHVGYFGAFYAPIRTPEALADLIRRTFARRPDLQERLFFHFYGEVFPEFWHALQRLPNTTLHGLQLPAHAQTCMQHMRVLVSVGNTTPWQLPSKAVSYLAAGRPVVHLSYTQADAFVRFWGEHPGLLVLRVSSGRVSDADLERWLAFLEKTPSPVPAAERMQRIEPFRADNIARAYLQLLEEVSQ